MKNILTRKNIDDVIHFTDRIDDLACDRFPDNNDSIFLVFSLNITEILLEQCRILFPNSILFDLSDHGRIDLMNDLSFCFDFVVVVRKGLVPAIIVNEIFADNSINSKELAITEHDQNILFQALNKRCLAIESKNIRKIFAENNSVLI